MTTQTAYAAMTCLALAGCGSSSSAPDAGDAGKSDSNGSVCDGSSTLMQQRRRVVVYYPLELGVSLDLANVDYTIVTHVVEHAVCTDASGNLNLVDLGKEFPVPNFVTNVHKGGGKAILGLCADPGDDVFGEMAAGATSRANYVKNVMGLVKEYGFDGLDIDWEFPKNETDESKLTKLVTELRNALGPDRTLSVTGPPTPGLAQYYDLAALAPLLDWFGAQTYWSKTIGRA